MDKKKNSHFPESFAENDELFALVGAVYGRKSSFVSYTARVYIHSKLTERTRCYAFRLTDGGGGGGGG